MENRIFKEQYGVRRKAFYRQPPFWIHLLQNYSKNRLQVVSDLLPDQKMRVLELGCGDGKFLFMNKRRWNTIIGVDVVRDRLQKAKERMYGCPSRFILRDYGREKMPFNSSSFDVCISIATLQYVYDLDLLFEEIRRVLREGGLWIFEVPNVAVCWRRLEFLRGRLPKTSNFENAWDAGVIHYFTYRDLMEFCVRKKFIVESVRTSGIMSSIRSLWPDMLAPDFIFVCKK